MCHTVSGEMSFKGSKLMIATWLFCKRLKFKVFQYVFFIESSCFFNPVDFGYGWYCPFDLEYLNFCWRLIFILEKMSFSRNLVFVSKSKGTVMRSNQLARTPDIIVGYNWAASLTCVTSWSNSTEAPPPFTSCPLSTSYSFDYHSQ